MSYKNLIIVTFLPILLSTNTFIVAQSFNAIKITSIVSGNETEKTLFTAYSASLPKLYFVLAERIDGPQEGVFTMNQHSIRYISKSNIKGVPNNLSRIRFSFLKSDKSSFITIPNVRISINDIDGPNNEALTTKCNINLRHIATAAFTNLRIDANPPELTIVGSLEESDGPTSRVLFEFEDIDRVEFDNYANSGYLKDFDFSYSTFKISRPKLVECTNRKEQLKVYLLQMEKNRFLKDTLNFKFVNESILLNIEPVYFRNDDFYIRDEAINKLEKVVQLLMKYPKMKLALESHTDSKLDDTYNLQLSENRANSTKEWIVSKGINSDRITAKGYGETKLVNGCLNNVKCSEKEHQLNRRTEFIVTNIEELLNLPE